MKRIFLLSFLMIGFLSILSTSKAQQAGDVILDLNYNTAFPLGGFKTNVIDKNSWRGWGGDVMYYMSDKIAAGLGANYQGFQEKVPSKTYTIGNENYTGVLSSRMNITPILAKGLYSPLGGTTSPIQPYVSLGVGVGVVDFDQYLGMYSTYSQTSGRFMAQGGIGFNIPFGKLTSNGIQLGANYNYINYNESYYNDNGSEGKLHNLGNINAYIGVHFVLR
ncbi:outer membrane beta-barrel protein [Rhizosphaericola mali]|uniref:Outer membrane beta-barrel protein n=1 Tax=Rhizosphaericola mali TaxID=2545455 RepID=A0A5P2G4H9_9BACT|nr:outer membrane beta-barrel protein [Rhizosphaericola mali]QES90736.1 outer membrane beta-barrel protein [Rhizosphaericola mali]